MFFDMRPSPWFEWISLKQNLPQSIFPFFNFVSNAGTINSCPSSPLFIPAKPEKKSVRRTRKHIKEGGGGSTDSEDPAVAAIKETSKKKQRKSQTNQKDSEGKAAGNKREEGRDRKDTEDLRRSTVAEKCEDQASSVREEQRATRNVTAPQTEQPQSNKTSKVLGKAGFIPVREDGKIEESQIFPAFQVEIQMTFNPSAHGVSFNILCGGKKKNEKEQQCFFSKIHCRMRKHWLSRTERNRRTCNQMEKTEMGKDWRTSMKNVWKWVLHWSGAQTNRTGSRQTVSKETAAQWERAGIPLGCCNWFT